MSPSLEALAQSLEPTLWQESSDPCELSSDLHSCAMACTHVLFHAYTCCGMHILLWHAYTAVACIHVLWRMYMCCGMHTHAVTCIHVLWHACMHCCGMHTCAVACIHVLWHVPTVICGTLLGAVRIMDLNGCGCCLICVS